MSDTEITAGVALAVVLVSLAYAIGVLVGWAARGMPDDDENGYLREAGPTWGTGARGKPSRAPRPERSQPVGEQGPEPWQGW